MASSASILFICTGNIFRSMIAEHALRAHLDDGSPWRASSAGTIASPMEIYPVVRQRLEELGVDPSRHVQRALTRDILDRADLPVAMSFDHRDFVRETFGRDIPLFNRVCFGRDEPVLDLGEALPGFGDKPEDAEAYARRMVDTIWESIPAFLRNAPRFLP